MTIIAPVDLTFFIKFRISFLVKLSCLLLLLRKAYCMFPGAERLGTGSSVNDGTDYPCLELMRDECLCSRRDINASLNPVIHLWLPTVSFLGPPPPSLLRFWATPPSPILDPPLHFWAPLHFCPPPRAPILNPPLHFRLPQTPFLDPPPHWVPKGGGTDMAFY